MKHDSTKEEKAGTPSCPDPLAEWHGVALHPSYLLKVQNVGSETRRT